MDTNLMKRTSLGRVYTKLDRVKDYLVQSIRLAFGDNVVNVEKLVTVEEGEAFDAFRLSFKKNLYDGVDNSEIETFIGCFKLPVSPSILHDYTFYAEDSQMSMSIALYRKK